MDSKKFSPLPLVFRVAAFYVFFSIFFLNAQPFIASWNNPVSHFLQKVYSHFRSTEITPTAVGSDQQQKKSDGGIVRDDVYPDPPPPPPPPK